MLKYELAYGGTPGQNGLTYDRMHWERRNDKWTAILSRSKLPRVDWTTKWILRKGATSKVTISNETQFIRTR